MKQLRRSIIPLMTLATTLRIARRTGLVGPEAPISRSTLLKVSGLGLMALVTGAWNRRSSASAAVNCVLAPEQTEGPYYIPGEKIRRNIAENRPGAPLQLRIAVVDATTCKPIKGAAVDIWHCDAQGIYSGFESASTGGVPGGNGGPTDKHTFMRGIQMTNARGYTRFQTVYPGWYRGRTVHIHLEVHLSGAVVGHVVHTGQLYFPETVTNTVYRTGIYKARASARDTFNTNDSIYRNGGRQSTLSVTSDGRGGYIGTITIGVRRF